MSKIEQLIKEKCPNGVEYKKINVVVDLYYGKGNNIPKDGGKYPVYGCNGIVGSTTTYNNEDTPIVGHIGSAGKVSWGHGKHYVTYNGTICKPKKNQINSRYLYHILLNLHLEKYVKGSQPFLSTSDFGYVKIPCPPIKVQEEIVRILDKFSELETELETELEARKRQYEFYKNKIFKFENRKDVKWLKLKEIAIEMYRGNGIKRKEITKEGVPCVRYGEIYTSYNIWFQKCISHTSVDVVPNPKTFTTNDLLFAITGENIEDIAKTVAYVGQETCYAGGDIVVLKHKQNSKYLSYALSTRNAILQKGKGKVKSKVVHSSIPSIQEIVIPIVKLEEQERIVKILDKFNKLINDISEGIPAEIEARRKQYEYYRNKLLSFEELKTND